jgi:hypothetical protein
LASRELDLHQFVACFFEVETGHDGQIDGSSEVDKVRVRLVLDFHGALLLGFLVVSALHV